MSKGDKRRPGDDKAFATNFDAIFGKKKPKNPIVERAAEMDLDPYSPDYKEPLAGSQGVLKASGDTPIAPGAAFPWEKK